MTTSTPSTNRSTNHVALYWDFENIHASLFESAKTFGRYAEKKRTQQPEIVNIQAVVEYAGSIRNLAINRSYGDWDYMGSLPPRSQSCRPRFDSAIFKGSERQERCGHSTRFGRDRGHLPLPATLPHHCRKC